MAIFFKGIYINSTEDLSRGNHISMTVNKANKALGSIKRTVGTAI